MLAARRLFAEKGYGATSMADIAAAAEVAVQTIYGSCGSKQDLVMALADAIDEEADVAALGVQLADSGDPREALALGVRLTRQLNERCGDIIGTLLSAATIAPEAGQAIAEGKRRHREGAARLGRKLGALGALRKDVSPRRAGALIAVLTWHPTYAQLVQEYGWSFDRLRAMDHDHPRENAPALTVDADFLPWR